jgi:hypothetical protein
VPLAILKYSRFSATRSGDRLRSALCGVGGIRSLLAGIRAEWAEIPSTYQRASSNWECASSNPPRSARQSGGAKFGVSLLQKSPLIAGFRNSVAGLQTPNWRSSQPKMPKVSGHSLNNSHFPETPAGDRVRSALGARAYSVDSSKSAGSALGDSNFRPALGAEPGSAISWTERQPAHAWRLAEIRADCGLGKAGWGLP